MSRRIRALALPLAALFVVGCGAKAGSERQARPAAAGAERASTEALCEEHGILEAICTKCNPKLVAVFQAKGDWCSEHGFPMSVCPVHHPERAGRPESAVAVDEAPASGTKVRFKTLNAARDAGIVTVAVEKGTAGGGISAPATIAADASHVAVVNPRAPGVVRSIQEDLGSRVAAGDPLALLESSAVGEDRSRLQAARARAAVAEANYRRAQELFDKGLAATREVEEARRDWEWARSDVAAAAGALGMVGATDDSEGTYILRAPIAGIVTRRTATVGTLVDTDDPLFEIVDTSQLWADIDVPEIYAHRVRPGQRVVLSVDGLPGREFHGVVKFVSPMIDPHTRTTKARATLPNGEGALRVNMFAKARIVDDGTTGSVLVPKEAVQDAKGVQLVFVQLAPDLYEARRVKAAPVENGKMAIDSDLRPDERVVTTGGFLLKTETLKESLGTGCCEVEAPKR